MKKFILFFSVLLLTNLVFADVFMTELADPNNNYNARFIELYNNGSTAVDFTEGSGWKINKYTNGSATVSNTINLTGTINANDFYIIAYDYTSGTFQSVYGFAPDQLDAVNNGVTGSNGDDTLELVDGSGTVVDFYGEQPHVDLTGTVWEYEDGRAERANGATSGKNPPADADWNTWSDGSGGDVVQTKDAPDDFDPGSWIGAGGGGNIPPSITNISQSPSEDITSSTTVSVSADVTDADGTISLVELHWGLASGSLTNTISMSNGGSGDTYTTSSDIPAQSNGSTVYYEVYAEDDVPEGSTSAEYNYTVKDAATTTLPYLEQFDSDLGDCYTKSVSGDTKEWNWNSSGYAQMNGYNSGVTEEDWLIFPGVNLDNYSDEIITFDSWYKYGTDDANNYLKLVYSTNYPGIGDPNSYSWTELNFTHPSAAETWTSSGDVDLSSISGTSVYIGLKYRYKSGSYRWWEIDNFSELKFLPIIHHF